MQFQDKRKEGQRRISLYGMRKLWRMKEERKRTFFASRVVSRVLFPLNFSLSLSHSVTAVEKSKDVKRKTQDYTPDAHSSAAGCLFDISLSLLFSSHASLLSSCSQRSFSFFFCV